MQKSYELASPPLVRLGKIEILQINDESLRVPWTIHTPSVGRYDHAHLSQLLNHVGSGGLGTAVEDGHLDRPELFKTVA